MEDTGSIKTDGLQGLEMKFELQNTSNGILAILYAVPFAIIVFKLLRDSD
jgi:hypothetical protein